MKKILETEIHEMLKIVCYDAFWEAGQEINTNGGIDGIKV